MKIVIIPKRWLFFRHTLPIFLGIHQVFLRQIGFAWRKDPSPLGTFPIFKQRLNVLHDYLCKEWYRVFQGEYFEIEKLCQAIGLGKTIGAPKERFAFAWPHNILHSRPGKRPVAAHLFGGCLYPPQEYCSTGITSELLYT